MKTTLFEYNNNNINNIPKNVCRVEWLYSKCSTYFFFLNLWWFGNITHIHTQTHTSFLYSSQPWVTVCWRFRNIICTYIIIFTECTYFGFDINYCRKADDEIKKNNIYLFYWISIRLYSFIYYGKLWLLLYTM